MRNDIILGIFSSAHKLDEKSEEFFNIKLEYGGICKACRENEKYKEFTFKYVSNLTQKEYIEYEINEKLKVLNRII